MTPKEKAILRKSAIQAIESLPPRHANARFLQFASENQLCNNLRTALWTYVMLRSNQCLEKMTGNPMCTCNICVEACDCCNDVATKAHDVVFCPIYPGYEWYPSKQCLPAQAETERIIHKYLVRMRKLPKPLPVTMFFRTHDGT